MDRRKFLKNLMFITAGLALGLPDQGLDWLVEDEETCAESLDWSRIEPVNDLTAYFNRMAELINNYQQGYLNRCVLVVPEWWWREYSEYLAPMLGVT